MKKTVKILVAGLLLLSILLTFAGCNTAKSVGKINNNEVESWIYSYYYNYAKNTLIENATSDASKPAKWNDIKGNAYNSTQSFEQAARDFSIERSYSYYITQQIFDELKLQFNKDDEDKTNGYYEDTKKQYLEQGENASVPFEKYLKDTKKISKENFMQIIKNDVRMAKISDYYFGEKGKTPITDKELKSTFEKDWARVKHVLIKSTDANNQKLTGEKLTAAKKKAEDILARATLKGESFEKLVDTYSEDPGSKAKDTKEGYEFYKDGSVPGQEGGFDPKFVAKSMELKIGGIGMQETDFGWHIIKRYAFAANKFDKYKDNVKDNIKNEKLNALYKEKRDKATVTKDDKAINKIK